MPQVLNEAKAPITLVAIARGESLYLLEWICYYKIIGIHNISIYDNGDNEDILDILSTIGLIKTIKWPSIEGISPQLSAYSHALTNRNESEKFIAFFDIDEFLFINTEHSLNHILRNIPDSIGAIALNQRVFGSSGHAMHRPGLVIQRFQKACPDQHPECLWGKSIYRSEYIEKITNSHRSKLRSGRHILPNGKEAFSHPTDMMTTALDFSIMQLNHYILKSEEEFEKKKFRGAVANPAASDRAKRYEDASFFVEREKYANNANVTSISKYAEAIISEIDELTLKYPILNRYSPLCHENIVRRRQAVF